ncbi:unnamed protein product, partial [Gulo gulo]
MLCGDTAGGVGQGVARELGTGPGPGRQSTARGRSRSPSRQLLRAQGALA